MNSDGKWYVRNTAGKVFGPIAFETLKTWVRDGRVEPLAGISEDLQNWMLAPLKPELEMDWVVENNPGQFYGPTHKSVVDDFVSSGTLSAGARFYCDDHGKTLEALKNSMYELETTKKELESVRAACAEEALNARNGFEAAEAEWKETLEKARSELEAVKAENAAEVESLRAEIDGLKSELEEVKAEKSAVHVREWKTEVLVPEVVVSNEPPPSIARTVFSNNQSSLAELERQAQAELARMGASGAKNFFGLGRKQ